MLLRDGVRSHPKILKAGAESAWVWACCIDYSRQQLTDGFVPSEALPTLANCRGRLPEVIGRLVDVGLLHREEGGVRVHDYLDHNDSADDVKEAKRRDAERKRGIQKESTGNPDGFQADSKRLLARARGCGYGTGSGSHLGRSGSHKAHALCGQVCLPGFLFSEFVRLRGGDEQAAREYVDQWWMALDDELAKGHGPIGNEVTYLRQRWEADHPVAKPAPKVTTFDVAAWAAKGA